MMWLFNSPRIGEGHPFELGIAQRFWAIVAKAWRTALKLADPRHNIIFGRTIAIWGRAYAAALRTKSRTGMRASIFPGLTKAKAFVAYVSQNDNDMCSASKSLIC
jgi:hypothetical protein